jgi:hypothetical protein
VPSIDVILESPELVVLGGPASIEVQLDTGATGQRGSTSYVGAGLPSSSTIPNYSSILPGDLYINASPGPNYSWLYQYLVKPGGNNWEPILSLNPALYNAVYEVSFVAGEATVSIPVSTITTTTTTLTSDNFAITFNFENLHPIAGSLKTKTLTSGNLILVFTAAEFTSSTWAALVDASVKMSIGVRVIAGSILL